MVILQSGESAMNLLIDFNCWRHTFSVIGLPPPDLDLLVSKKKRLMHLSLHLTCTDLQPLASSATCSSGTWRPAAGGRSSACVSLWETKEQTLTNCKLELLRQTIWGEQIRNGKPKSQWNTRRTRLSHWVLCNSKQPFDQREKNNTKLYKTPPTPWPSVQNLPFVSGKVTFFFVSLLAKKSRC